MKLWFWMWSDLSTIQFTILHGTEPAVPYTQFILCTDNVTVRVEFQLRACQDLCYPYHENATFYSSLKQRRNLHWKKKKNNNNKNHPHTPKNTPYHTEVLCTDIRKCCNNIIWHNYHDWMQEQSEQPLSLCMAYNPTFKNSLRQLLRQKEQQTTFPASVKMLTKDVQEQVLQYSHMSITNNFTQAHPAWTTVHQQWSRSCQLVFSLSLISYPTATQYLFILIYPSLVLFLT